MNKSVLKNVTSCIVFLGILIFFFINITWLFRGNEGISRKLIQGFKNQGNVDVVLVGGSTEYCFYSPMQVWKESGITSYNYATSRSRLDLVESFVKDVRETVRAKLFVIDVRTIAMLQEQIDEVVIRNWSDSLNPLSVTRIEGINNYILTREYDIYDLPSYYLDIIKYHSHTDVLAKADQWGYMNSQGVYNKEKGFVPETKIAPFVKNNWDEQRKQLNSLQMQSINRILDYCDKERIQVLFICCPYIFSQQDMGVINTCGDIIEERGYTFENFNKHVDEIGLDYETDFYDANHVNYWGAVKYTQYFNDYLVKNYELEDHRGDTKYEQWDRDYEDLLPTMSQWEEEQASNLKKLLITKELGDNLSQENDYFRWFSDIRNDGLNVIIRINGQPEGYYNKMFHSFLEEYDIDVSKDNYIGIWQGKKKINTSSKEESMSVNIGTNISHESIKCEVSNSNNSITIAGAEYKADKSPIQVVVYDKNYNKVVDNVNIRIKYDSVELVRW